MAHAIFNAFKKGLLQGSYNLGGTPTIYAALVSNSYSPDVDLHAYHSDLSHIVTPSNYVAQILLSSPVISTNNTTNQGVLDAEDVLLANVTFGTDVRGAVLFGSSGNGSASDPLYGYIDFTEDKAVTAGTFQIQWASGGILALT